MLEADYQQAMGNIRNCVQDSRPPVRIENKVTQVLILQYAHCTCTLHGCACTFNLNVSLLQTGITIRVYPGPTFKVSL